MKEYYRLLGLPQTATKEEIKKAYRTLSKRYHPDMPNGNSEIYIKIKEAYEILAKGEPVPVQPPPPTKRDMTPYVLVANSYISSDGKCIIFLNARNIDYVFIDRIPMDEYKWTLGSSIAGRIEILENDMFKYGYQFNLVFVAYDGNVIFKPIKLKDPRNWAQKIGYKVKKFLDL